MVSIIWTKHATLFACSLFTTALKPCFIYISFNVRTNNFQQLFLQASHCHFFSTILRLLRKSINFFHKYQMSSEELCNYSIPRMRNSN